MTHTRSLLRALHAATHRVPGVPGHAKRPRGHHGNAHHGRPAHASAAGHGANHSPARPPRVLAAWQRRVAAFFGRDLR